MNRANDARSTTPCTALYLGLSKFRVPLYRVLLCSSRSTSFQRSNLAEQSGVSLSRKNDFCKQTVFFSCPGLPHGRKLIDSDDRTFALDLDRDDTALHPSLPTIRLYYDGSFHAKTRRRFQIPCLDKPHHTKRLHQLLVCKSSSLFSLLSFFRVRNLHSLPSFVFLFLVRSLTFMPASCTSNRTSPSI